MLFSAKKSGSTAHTKEVRNRCRRRIRDERTSLRSHRRDTRHLPTQRYYAYNLTPTSPRREKAKTHAQVPHSLGYDDDARRPTAIMKLLDADQRPTPPSARSGHSIAAPVTGLPTFWFSESNSPQRWSYERLLEVVPSAYT